MIRQPASSFGKVVQALGKRAAHIIDRADLHPCRISQLLHVRRESGIRDIQRLLRSECGEDLCRKSFLCKQAVILQIVRRIICRAECAHIALCDQRTCSAFGTLKLPVGTFPDAVCSLRTEQIVDSEKSLQLQMRPVVDRIADEARHDRCKPVEFLMVVRIACDILLRNGVGTHDTPFVVVSCQPRLADVRKPLVLIDLGGIQVTVVIKDRHLLGMLMVQSARRLGGEKKFFIDESLHFCYLSFSVFCREIYFSCSFYYYSNSLSEISHSKFCLKHGDKCYIISSVGK